MVLSLFRRRGRSTDNRFLPGGGHHNSSQMCSQDSGRTRWSHLVFADGLLTAAQAPNPSSAPGALPEEGRQPRPEQGRTRPSH